MDKKRDLHKCVRILVSIVFKTSSANRNRRRQMEVVQQKDKESIQNVCYLNLRYLDAKMAEKLKNRS